MRQAIAMVSQDERLKKAVDSIEGVVKLLEARQKFLNKQAEKEAERFNKQLKPLWKELEGVLGELKLLPKEYDSKVHHIGFDREGNIIYIRAKNEGFISNIFNGLLQ